MPPVLNRLSIPSRCVVCRLNASLSIVSAPRLSPVAPFILMVIVAAVSPVWDSTFTVPPWMMLATTVPVMIFLPSIYDEPG